MMPPDQELLALAARLQAAGRPEIRDVEQRKLDGLVAEAEKAGRAFSGSWLGYHACVYYEDLRSAPPGPFQSGMGSGADVLGGDNG